MPARASSIRGSIAVMTKLIECPGCTRHVRVDDGRCPFCGRPSTTSAPARVLALVLPLTLMACTGGESPPAGKAQGEATKPVEPKPVEPAPVEPKPVEPELVDPVQPSQPSDAGDQADPLVPSDDRIMTTKYGGPPAMDDGGLAPPKPVVEPERPAATKYGAPPVRPAKKYGAPPKPGPGDDPFG